VAARRGYDEDGTYFDHGGDLRQEACQIASKVPRYLATKVTPGAAPP
jgi:hypothetical protein